MIISPDPKSSRFPSFSHSYATPPKSVKQLIVNKEFIKKRWRPKSLGQMEASKDSPVSKQMPKTSYQDEQPPISKSGEESKCALSDIFSSSSLSPSILRSPTESVKHDSKRRQDDDNEMPHSKAFKYKNKETQEAAEEQSSAEQTNPPLTTSTGQLDTRNEERVDGDEQTNVNDPSGSEPKQKKRGIIKRHWTTGCIFE